MISDLLQVNSWVTVNTSDTILSILTAVNSLSQNVTDKFEFERSLVNSNRRLSQAQAYFLSGLTSKTVDLHFYVTLEKDKTKKLEIDQ